MARVVLVSVVMRRTFIVIALVAPLAAACAAETGTTEEEDSTEVADPLRGADCLGPFDCKLPNPHAANANRATDPVTGGDHFPLAAGTALVNGFGGSMGTVKSSSIQVDFGQRKIIGGVSHVYAFAVTLTSGEPASGWVDERAVGDRIGSMPTVSGRDPGAGDYQTVFTVTGGNPAAYGDLKVDPDFTGSHEAAVDYLAKPNGVINLLYNLPGVGGVSTDTLPLGTHFHRAHGVRAVYINLYRPGGSQVVGKMEFVYGHIGSRYGWIAREALSS